MTKWGCILLGILALSHASDAYRILVASPLKGKSHAILAEGMIRHLQKAGHEITYVAGFAPSKPIPNVTVVETTYELEDDKFMNLEEYMKTEISLSDLKNMFTMMSNLTTIVMSEPNVQALMKDKSQYFDVAIVEWLYSDLYSAFAAAFDCPLIWLSTVEPHWKVLKLVDESTNPAYTTDTFSGNIPPFTFTQRLIELGFQIMGRVADYLFFNAPEQEGYDKYVAPIIRAKGRPVPDLATVKHSASLILGNSHVSLGSANRLPECYKHIGGFHIDRDVKPLPEHIKKIFDSATHGLIYFSMGSNLESKSLPKELKQGLLAMFGKLKQTVLWKFEEDLPNRPPNVHILKWAPQQSILAHKKCILFITHGGLLSTTEAVHFGVPTIGIPVFGDQFVNVARAVKKGYARKVNLSFKMYDDLYKEINEVLANPSYTEKVKELSLIYHDRPVTPGVELVHWVEHVAKTRGAPHLRSPALLVPWYQKIYLDLVLILVAIALAIKYAICYLINYLMGVVKRSDKKKRN